MFVIMNLNLNDEEGEQQRVSKTCYIMQGGHHTVYKDGTVR